jgi:flagellar basal body rod protein FlgG
MGREIYPAMSGGIRALKTLDSVANNLANLNTTGFKADRPTFKLEAPAQSRNLDPNTAEGRLANAYAVLDGVSTDYSQGVLRETGSMSDLAIRGEGFFHLRDAAGKSFVTRDGSFHVNVEGFLVTRDGLQVQQRGGGGGVQVGDGEFRVTEQGELKVGEDTRGRIAVVEAADAELSKVGGNRWVVDEKAVLADGESQILQRHLEASNVQPILALTEMIALSRYYEAFQDSLSTSSELDEKLNNRVGRVDQ